VLATRIADLTGYQDAAYAARYAEEVRRVRDLAVAAAGAEPGERIALAYARGLHKLMAYKDEYEVARLHLDPAERARLTAEFGEGSTLRYKLHPPMLRALGLEHKITLGPWFEPAFRVLCRMKRLRGTRLDPFGLDRVRRVERALPGVYRGIVERALAHAGTASYDALVELCELPGVIRGYEDVKLRGVERFHTLAQEQLERIEAGAASPLAVGQRG